MNIVLIILHKVEPIELKNEEFDEEVEPLSISPISVPMLAILSVADFAPDNVISANSAPPFILKARLELAPNNNIKIKEKIAIKTIILKEVILVCIVLDSIYIWTIKIKNNGYVKCRGFLALCKRFLVNTY